MLLFVVVCNNPDSCELNSISFLIYFGRLNLSMDKLYDECTTANSILHHLTEATDWGSKGTAERWVAVLRGRAADLPNILAVLSFVLSIPSSTGYVERVFSLMKNKWSDVRNRCSVELIKSQLIVTLNYEMSCSVRVLYSSSGG